jgi:hypothetical protein
MLEFWKISEEEILRRLYPQREAAPAKKKVKEKRHKNIHRRFWTAEEDEQLRRLYPNTLSARVAEILGRKVGMVHQHAAKLGIKKSAEWKASDEACKLRRSPEVGAATRFKPGLAPWNKGMKYPPGWAPGRMRETQFKKGQKPYSWLPIGSTRYSKEGYLQRKVTDTGYPPRDWVGEHILIWCGKDRPGAEDGAFAAQPRPPERQVPKGHKVTFRDGDKTHIALENLELVTCAEMMRRNSVHNLPPELRSVIQLAGALGRMLREKGIATPRNGDRFAGTPAGNRE